MIRSILITDSNGKPYYSKILDENFEEIEPVILSGLISAIQTIGKKLFNDDLATIYFGDRKKESISIVTKRILNFKEETIFFVYFIEGDIELKKLRSLSTQIFIETKNYLKHPEPDLEIMATKIDKVLQVFLNIRLY